METDRPSTDFTAPGSDAPSENTADRAKQHAEKAARDVRREGMQAVEELKSEAGSAVESAKSTGRRLANEQKSALAQKVTEYEEAAKAAASKLHDGGDTAVAERLNRIAGRLGNASSYLKEAKLEDLWRDGGNLARRHPELALGGMYVAGLLIARFLKASDRKKNGFDSSSREFRTSSTQGDNVSPAPEPIPSPGSSASF